MTGDRIRIDSWDDLRFFLAVSRTGTFSLAARSLGTDQSTVSRRLASLEQQLDAPLFERTRRGAVPTAIGRRLRAQVEHIEAEIKRVADTVATEDHRVAGRVRLAMTEGIAVHFVIPRVLPVLRARYPELTLEVVTGERIVDLSDHEADMALRFYRTPHGDLIGKRVIRLQASVLAERNLAARVAGLPASELSWIGGISDKRTSDQPSWLEHVGAPQPSVRCSSLAPLR